MGNLTREDREFIKANIVAGQTTTLEFVDDGLAGIRLSQRIPDSVIEGYMPSKKRYFVRKVGDRLVTELI
jgi:hypothetical protein